jgi:hypothetical protein
MAARERVQTGPLTAGTGRQADRVLPMRMTQVLHLTFRPLQDRTTGITIGLAFRAERLSVEVIEADVSQPPVIISYKGEVRLRVAKASSLLSRTG